MANSLKKFENFIYAFGAARVLLRRAHEQGFLIEGMALYASLTDGFLRIGLVLKRQLVNKNSDVDETLISQEKGGRYYTERQIYRMALDEGVIGRDAYDQLSTLYDKRNDVIHKFFLTPLRYAELPEPLKQYEKLYSILNEAIYKLEAEQISKGVGMTGPGKTSEATSRAIHEEVLRKIDASASSPTEKRLTRRE